MAERAPVSVVVPAFNEEEGIAKVLEDLRRVLDGRGAPYEILVVDDGSRDRTADLVEASGAAAIRHPVNRGYGRALASGIAQARHDWVLTIDGDGSYPADSIPALLEAMSGVDMVVGAREGSVFWGSPFQALLRRIYLFLVSFVVGESVPDANSGLRVFSRAALRASAPIQCIGYSFSTTLTLSFLQDGRFVRFLPIPYFERKGRSKVRKVRDILRTLQILAQVMVFYNPLKLAVTLAAAPALLSLAALGRWLCRGGDLNAQLAALNFLGALGVFLTGCVLEQIRLNGGRRPAP